MPTSSASFQQPSPTWQTPKRDGERLIEPELASWLHLAEANRAERNAATPRLVYFAKANAESHSWQQFCRAGQREFFTAALQYTGSYRAVELPTINEQDMLAIYLAGHQPELFHPGVWVKNGLLSRAAQIETARFQRAREQRQALANFANEQGCSSESKQQIKWADSQNSTPHASQHYAVAINLIVDSDLIKSGSVRVPAGSIESPRLASVNLDAVRAGVPWELRTIENLETLSTFCERLLEVGMTPADAGCWREYWPLLLDRARATNNLGLAIAQARHLFEQRFNWQTLELPLSHVMKLPSVQTFLLACLSELPRWRDYYNSAVIAYRQAHHTVSSAHPAPLLGKDGEWLEAPLWVYSKAEPQRRRVWCRRQGVQIELSDRLHWQWQIALINGSADRPTATQAWQELEAAGIFLRPKALITTMLARALLSDLFVHGIGGAKYDAVTDQMIEEFLGVPAPRFAVASGTLRWPRNANTQQPNIVRTSSVIKQEIRSTRFHPEKHLTSDIDASPEIASTVAVKKAWLDKPKTKSNATKRHQAITAANEALQPAMTAIRERLEAELKNVVAQMSHDNILNSRELPFVLHSTERFSQWFAEIRSEGISARR